MLPLENLKSLRDDMVSKNENFDIFEFQYKGKKYFVIVEVFEQDKKPEFALGKLIFLRFENVTDKFETWANSKELMSNAKTIREFFGIDYSKQLGVEFQTLFAALGNAIPYAFSSKRKNKNKDILSSFVISSDPEDPNRKYCFAVRRTGGTRRPYNDEKTKLLRPKLYDALGKYKEVSFLYSNDPNDEKDTRTIIENFEKNRIQ